MTTMMPLLASMAVISGIWLAWIVIRWVWLRPRAIENCLRKQGLNGPSYRLLHGDINQLATMSRKAALNFKPLCFSDDFLPIVLPFYHHIIHTYGKNSFSWIGPTARITIMDPELIKEVLVNNYKVFKKPTPNPLVRFLASGVAGYEDQKWAKHRRILAPAFTQDKLKHMFSAMYMSCNDILVKPWSKLVSENGSCELDVQPYIDDFSSDVISRNAFGSRYEQGRRIYQLQKEQAMLTSKVLRSIYLPGRRYLPTKTNRRMKQIDSELRSILSKIMEKKEHVMLSKESDDHENLLSLLLKSTTNINENLRMSVDEVMGECKSIYFAGQESSSNLLLWTMILLSQHPTWQTRAREDVHQVFGHNKPSYEGLNHLKIVTMILYEVLRLYSPATIFTRITYNETTLGNLTVPAGVQLLLPVIFVHHDREIWGEDAKEFNPERFSEGIAKATKNRVAFFPFSWGPRICIGDNFALMEAKLAISTILQHFSFELSPSYSHSPVYVVTLQPRHGAHLILHKIKPSSP